MAVQPVKTELRVNTNVDGTRLFTALADVQDTAAGLSVRVVITQQAFGAAPPAAPNSFTLSFRIDNTTTEIRTVTLTAGADSQEVTFFFTATGASGGTARCGLVRMRLHAIKNNGLASENYNANSDDTSGQVLPTGWVVDVRNQGWIRGTTTLTEMISNVALGGAKNEPAEYNESLFVRTVCGADSYAARALTVAVANTTPALSAATSSTTAATRAVTFANVIDDRFPAGLTADIGIAVTVPNAALTAVPDFTFSATTDDVIDVDPNLTATHHFQIDDNVFALAKNDTNNAMLATQSGFLAVRLVGSRGTGQNGITVTQTLTPVKPGTAVSASSATAARDGQDGWSDLLAWTSSKPGGAWNKSLDITAPTDIEDAAYLAENDSVYTLLSPNPNYTALVSGGRSTDTKAHLVPGKELIVGMAMRNSATRKYVVLDTNPAPSVQILRFNTATGKGQYLASNGSTWTDIITNGVEAEVYQHVLTQGEAANDPNIWTKTFSAAQTADWGYLNIFLLAVAYEGGTPYSVTAQVEVTGSANNHDKYKYDPIGDGYK